MRRGTKFLILGGVLALSAVGFVLQVIQVPVSGLESEKYTRNSGELVAGSLVGQTFVSPRNNLSGIGIQFATYSGRENTEPIIFVLKESLDSSEELRRVEIDPHDLGDNQMYQISFDVIPNSLKKQFFFSVVSPTSSPGNAVTVDINTQDPYHLGTAFLVREQVDGITPEIIARSGKQTVDVSFDTYHLVSARKAIIEGSITRAREFVATWDEKRSFYVQWFRAFVPAVVLMWAFFWLPKAYTTKTRRLILVTIFAVAIVFRFVYATSLPATNDEGNYLYDAFSLRHGVLAGGDGYVKSPLTILWIAIWQVLGGNTLIAGRLASIVIGSATLFPLYFIGREMRGEKLGLYAALFWALLGVTTVFNIYVHTQPVALFFGISGIAVLWRELRRPQVRTKWLLLAGVLLGLGVASRKSILAFGLMPIALIWFESFNVKLVLKRLVIVAIGFLLILSLFLGVATFVYGTEGFWEALGYNSANDGISTIEPHQVAQTRAYSIRGMTPFFRESLPIILLATLGLGFLFEHLMRSFVRRQFKPGMSLRQLHLLDLLVPKLGWLFAFYMFWQAWRFFFEYEGEAFMKFGVEWLWWFFLIVIGGAILLPRPRSDALELLEKKTDKNGKVVEESAQPVTGAVARSTQPAVSQAASVKSRQGYEGVESETLYTSPDSMRAHIVSLLVPVLWLAGVTFFYFNWIKFHANYIGEFLPPLVLLSVFGMYAFFMRLQRLHELSAGVVWQELLLKLLIGLTVVVITWSMTVSNYITYVFEHTGTFQLSSIKEAATWAADNIPRDQPIFTGAAIIPYISGHRVALDIAHPRWYAYEFVRTDTTRIETFLPSAEEMVQAYRDAEWLLLEKQTGFSFLMEYSEIEAGIEADWQAVKGIENGSNTLTFYRRVR